MGKLTIIRKEGGSSVITITAFIPKEWIAVDIEKVNLTDTELLLKLEKVK